MKFNKELIMDRNAKIQICARAAHEFNRAYCIYLGDSSQLSWDDSPSWQCTSSINGVVGVLSGNTPEQSHESWLEEKQATGWTYGPIKDSEKKEHPCFVHYNDLPEDQRLKDEGYVQTVRLMAKLVGLI